jgi:anti-anti-sigma factor
MGITVREHGQVVIFDLAREIRRGSESLQLLIKAQLALGKRDILLNFAEVEFIDSFGVGELLASYQSIHNAGGRFKLCRVSKKIFLIFEITQINRILEIFGDCDGALKSFEKL